MCTVSFIARKSGYALGMNRDEQLTRIRALPPKKFSIQGRTVVCPSEPGGGTWIALNNASVTFALINWYSVTARAKGKSVSRGRVVNAVCAFDSESAASNALEKLPLKKINPFRLIGIFPAMNKIIEWRWNRAKLIRKLHPWKTQQWVSSGFDEPTAQRIRGKTFRFALRQKSAGGLDWLRRLHRSHGPERGAFSTCMHRSDAATVSYTEIVVSRNRLTMKYFPGAPCRPNLACD